MTRAERMTAGALAFSVLGSIGFVTAYALHAGNGWLGACVAAAAAGLCIALAVWGLRVVQPERVVDERESFAAEEGERVVPAIARPRLVALLLGAAGAIAAAALVPLRSLGPRPGPEPLASKWRPGVRLVGIDGAPIARDALNVDAVVTAFPEGAVGDAASQVMLLRLPDSDEIVRADRRVWSPDGYLAFSKVCTHAGCPVALYRAKQRQLMCPCHQSIFDVLDGARVVSGPAARPLPQLPLEEDERGYLRARADLDGPVGPGHW